MIERSLIFMHHFRSFKISSLSTDREFKGYFQSFLCTFLTTVVTYDPCNFFLIFTADPCILFTTSVCETLLFYGEGQCKDWPSYQPSVVAAMWVFCRKEVYCKVVTK